MTREEAIKHIITYAYYDDDIPLQVATALDMAISALRAQQEQESKPLNGWISVQDRLPDYFTSVLVWCPGNKCIYAAYRNARQEWYTFDDTIAGHVVVNMVTHWMPMPNPPKGE